jgi:hypothetical protein
MAELEMVGTNPDSTRPARTPAILKALLITFFLSTVLLSGWTVLKYLRPGSLQGYIQEGIKLSLSNFQIEIALAGLTGLTTSLLLQRRRRSRKANSKQPRMIPMSFGDQKPVHPLMMTPRPSRDTSFVIRKTRNRGRISRNNMGERLPPSFVSESEAGHSS